MKKGFATRKVTGGKLVRVEVLLTDERIESILLTGDFFLHPEDLIGEVEQILGQAKLPLEKQKLAQAIDDLLRDRSAQLIGAGAEDMVNTLEEAVLCATA